MTTVSKVLITVVVTTTLVALLGYAFGFAMLFAHTMSEIFWYGLLFGGSNILALSVVAFFSKSDSKEQAKSKAPATADSKAIANPAT